MKIKQKYVLRDMQTDKLINLDYGKHLFYWFDADIDGIETVFDNREDAVKYANVIELLEGFSVKVEKVEDQQN